VRFHIEYSPDAVEHLQSLTAFQRALVVDGVDTSLTHQPTVETRNRKLMKPNLFAQWELRIRNLRVFYKVHVDDRVVSICGVGVKVGNRVRIANEELELS
jgi:mRNA-degrading endonuclease RelE of RelBE toxin-antitoxin system